MNRLLPLLAAVILLVPGGAAQAEDTPAQAAAKLTDAQAPQRFLDAWRDGDEDALAAIARAPQLDVFRIADALLRSHLGAVLADPSDPRDYLEAARGLAERASRLPAGANLPPLVAAWGKLEGTELRAAHRLGLAQHAATVALSRGDYDRVHRIVSAVAEDIRTATSNVNTAYLHLLDGLAFERAARLHEGATAFDRGAALAKHLGWRLGTGDCLSHGSSCAYQLQDFRRARALAEEALALHRELDRPADVTSNERNLAIVLLQTGEPGRARRHATRLREHYTAAGNASQAASMLLVLSSAAAALGEHDEVTRLCEQAAAEFVALGDPLGTTSALTQLGGTLSHVGQHAAGLRALDLADEALGERAAVTLRGNIAQTRGVIHRRVGMLEEAAQFQEEALARFIEAENPTGAARARSNLAILRLEQGEPAAAAAIWERQLADWQQQGQASEVAHTAANLAAACMRSGRYAEAESAAETALEGFRALGNRELKAHVERVLAEIALERGDVPEARRRVERAVAGFEEIAAGNPLEVQAHRILARVHLRQGHPAQALETLERAGRIEQTLGHGLGELTGLGLRGRARPTSDLGVLAARALATAEPERRAEALAAAYAFAERGRGLLLAEQLANASVLLARHLPTDLLRADALTRSDVAAARRVLVRQMAAGAPDPEHMSAARGDLDEAWTRRRETLARIQREARHVADLVYPRSAQIDEVRRQLDADTALVVFHGTDGILHALVITDTGGRIHDLGAEDEIAKTARRYLRLVAAPGAPEARLASRLHARLIKPLEADLAGRSRLILCPDGVLAFLPWAALRTERDGRAQRLVERWESVLVPSATVFVTLAREARGAGDGTSLVALGNPTYPGAPGEGVAPPFAPLPASAAEVAAIARLFPRARRRVLLGSGASLPGLEDALAGTDGRLRALHLACHAYVDDAFPFRSTLVLAGGAMMDLDTIYRLRTPADLVVISACASARGKVLRGEGALGFVRGFFFSGARRVLASNWKVADDSTRDLMTCFYEGLVRDGLPHATALRRAQLAALEAGGETAHPHHWAAFTLWGLPD